MSNLTKQTFAETRFIKELKQQFSVPLAYFLLSGYGSAEVLQSRSLTIQEKTGRRKNRLLKITTIDPRGLPNGREPLVLNCLLKLLSENDDHTGVYPVVPFPVEAIMDILGWEESDETHGVIHSAIRKYFNVSYVEIIDLSQTFDRAISYTGHIEHLIVSYMYSSDSGVADEVGNEMDETVCMEVKFNEKLTEELMKKQLFGIMWETATITTR